MTVPAPPRPAEGRPARGVTAEPFGTLPGGRAVEAFRLAAGGAEAVVLSYGAALQALRLPDRDGATADVALGYDGLDGYLDNGPYLGVVVGRVANRVRGGRAVLDGREVQLDRNHGRHHIHGGAPGLGAVIWDGGADGGGVTLRYHSPDGEGGYPGALDVTTRYALEEDGGGVALSVDFEAVTDAPTFVNLAHHAYLDLAATGDRPAGSADVLGHRAAVPAPLYLSADGDGLTTGEVVRVDGTPLDLRGGAPLAERVGADDGQVRLADGVDHDLVLGTEPGADGLRDAGSVEAPSTGRRVDVRTTEPVLHLYAGGHLDGTRGKGGVAYGRYGGLCLETQRPSGAPSHPHLASVVLRPGETYRARTVYRFSTR